MEMATSRTMRRVIPLRLFIFGSSLMVSMLSFACVLSISVVIYVKTIEHNAMRIAGEISRQFDHSIALLMAKGWSRKDLLTLYNDPRQAASSVVQSVQIYRTGLVEELYGKSDLPPDSVVTTACRTRTTIERKQQLRLDIVYPLAADAECLSCHGNARKGEILGALVVRQNLEPMLQEARNTIFAFSLLLIPLPLLLAGLISRFVNRRVGGAIAQLHDKVTGVNKVSDLTQLVLSNIPPGFVEFEQIFGEIGTLVSKIRQVSVGKEALELEMRILGKFIITSEVIRNWKDRVSGMLLDFNLVVPTYTFFCIFQESDGAHLLEIFLRGPVSTVTRKTIELTILDAIHQENPHLTAMPITYSIADDAAPILELHESIVQAKTLILGTPQIGGVVGIGILAEQAQDTIGSLVIDSTLATLLNVVGSIKAISTYTKELEYHSIRDALTDLYNHRAFWEFIGYEINRAQRHEYNFALLLIDLDNFKTINDTWGHALGDQYLAAFAAKVREVLRQGDIFCRYGGDEFTVILPETDEAQAFLVAGRIREITESLYVTALDGAKARATTSIGFAVFPRHARTAKDLFLFADRMTYQSKDGGKNRVTVPTEHDVIELFRQTGETTRLVMDALEEKRFVPFFQPIVPLRDHLSAGCEVLCRLELPGKVLTAAEFIETAEQLGVVSKMDLILLEKTFALAREQHFGGNLFINLSPKALILPEFLPDIVRLAARHGIDHSRVVFELTERETVKNLSILEKFVHELKAYGFKFAIDDFGSGFSSFQYIRRFPIDFVKIEGEFILNMRVNYKDMAFVKTLVVLAHEFNIKTIAECIETEELLVAVRELGVDYAQGYYLGYPSPTITPPTSLPVKPSSPIGASCVKAAPPVTESQVGIHAAL